MNGLLQYQFGLWVVAAGLFILRQCLMVGAADMGRKHDLIKKLYKNTQEFHLSVLIPFLDPNDHPALLTLLHAISEQDYPAAKVTVHLVATEETHHELIPQSLRPNVKVWEYPAQGKQGVRYEHAVTWLIDRCLAAGGNGMLVFLKPTDIVKPDFFQNIVARGIDSFAIQGYVACKNPPETPLAKVAALSTRLFNRIGNAGRHHLGLSCRLQDSGWAIKQEVLEMIPYQRGWDVDNLEYTIRLNLQNFRVNWAPNVVVYADSDTHFLQHLTLSVGAFFNRLRLLGTYGPKLLTRALHLNHLELLLDTIKLPYLATLLVLGTLAILDLKSNIPIPPDQDWFWAVVAMLTLALNVAGLVVARCKASDYVTMLFTTPITYLFGLVASPIALFNYLSQTLGKRTNKGSRYRKSQKTRFNEDLEPPPNLFDDTHGQGVIRNILKKNAPQDEQEFESLVARTERKFKKNPALGNRTPTEENTSEPPVTSRLKLPRETVKAVPLSNGQKQIQCTLKTLTTFDEAGNEHYRLTLEHKAMAFSTESYRILDQAYYELQAKLMSRGLTLITCGSCGYFYNPTADVPGALKNTGVCLFGKTGREVHLTTDAVTVISQACSYHSPLDQREAIVRQWKESLTLSRSK